MVAAARKYERIVQVGTQSRSTDVSQQAAEFVQSGQLGKLLYAHAIVYRRRTSIGRVEGPPPVPESVDYNLWLGPAQKTKRCEFHYDWHWQWETGNGEIGNNGVHILDRCRWLLGQGKLPHRAMSIGGRFLFDDDGETPNTQIALLDYRPAPLICEVRGLPEKPNTKSMDKFRSIPMGVIVQCEGGAYIAGTRTGSVFDRAGTEIKVFKDRRDPGEQPHAHQANFIAAMRSRRSADLNAEILEGHLSTSLCHMANVSHRMGTSATMDVTLAATRGNPQWEDAFDRFRQHLDANGVDLNTTPAILGPWVTMNSDSTRFIGAHAEKANSLSRRKDRKPFVVPEIT
jgi:predicted dehydrogenase